VQLRVRVIVEGRMISRHSRKGKRFQVATRVKRRFFQQAKNKTHQSSAKICGLLTVVVSFLLKNKIAIVNGFA